jgi:catechol 2,3-dioxygenase-like lactoylglutathione lyase family enzyme
MIKIVQLDHLVLTVADINRTNEFYQRVLGMKPKQTNERRSLHFGTQKINLHALGHEFEPKAEHPTPGSADLCLISETPMAQILEHLKQLNINVIEGPVRRTGAQGALLSVYFRDPDRNLIEVANQLIKEDVK